MDDAILMSSITITRYMHKDGEEFMDVSTEPEISVAEAVGMLTLATNEIMNGQD